MARGIAVEGMRLIHRWLADGGGERRQRGRPGPHAGGLLHGRDSLPARPRRHACPGPPPGRPLRRPPRHPERGGHALRADRQPARHRGRARLRRRLPRPRPNHVVPELPRLGPGSCARASASPTTWRASGIDDRQLARVGRMAVADPSAGDQPRRLHGGAVRRPLPPRPRRRPRRRPTDPLQEGQHGDDHQGGHLRPLGHHGATTIPTSPSAPPRACAASATSAAIWSGRPSTRSSRRIWPT